jgi:ubiquinone/menaquinone biosynthesis C-methylase UbiE
MRIVTRDVAFDPSTWTSARAREVAELFDSLAAGWDERFHAAETQAPLRDALARGGPFGTRCIEIGAGTGRATGALVDVFADIVALDLADEMLRLFGEPRAARVRGDASQLPFAAGSADALVLVNAFLFPDEVDRVLAPGGAVIWVNTLAEDTPIHLPVHDVLAALPGSWRAVTSEAGWGMWAVVRRAAADDSTSGER